MTKEERSTSRVSRFAPVALALAALIGMLSSCNLLNLNSVVKPASVSACISGFSNAYMSGNYSILYQYFSVNTSMYNQIKPATFWDANGGPYWSGYNPQAMTITGNPSANTYTATFTNLQGTNTATITMEQDSGYWYMLTLSVDLGSTNVLTVN